jgi:hypothetical protein
VAVSLDVWNISPVRYSIESCIWSRAGKENLGLSHFIHVLEKLCVFVQDFLFERRDVGVVVSEERVVFEG